MTQKRKKSGVRDPIDTWREDRMIERWGVEFAGPPEPTKAAALNGGGNPYHCPAGTGETSGRFTDANGTTCNPLTEQLSDLGLDQREQRLQNLLASDISAERQKRLQEELRRVEVERQRRETQGQPEGTGVSVEPNELDMRDIKGQESLFPGEDHSTSDGEVQDSTLEVRTELNPDGWKVNALERAAIGTDPEDKWYGELGYEPYDMSPEVQSEMESLVQKLNDHPKFQAMGEAFGWPEIQVVRGIEDGVIARTTFANQMSGTESFEPYISFNADVLEAITAEGSMMSHGVELTMNAGGNGAGKPAPPEGRFLMDPSMEGSLYHEVGHWFDRASGDLTGGYESLSGKRRLRTGDPIQFSKSGKFHEAVRELTADYHGGVIAGEISTYAKQDAQEMLAESVSTIAAPDYDKSLFSPRVQKWLTFIEEWLEDPTAGD